MGSLHQSARVNPNLTTPGDHPNYPSIAEHCNLWRNFDDISDSWTSVLSIIDFYGDDKDGFASLAGPGQWNDPDMLIIGNFGLSLDQVRVVLQFYMIVMNPGAGPDGDVVHASCSPHHVHRPAHHQARVCRDPPEQAPHKAGPG